MDYRNWMGNAAIILAVIASTSLVGWGVVRDHGKAMPADPFVAVKKMAAEQPLAAVAGNQQQSVNQRTQQQYNQNYTDTQGYTTNPQARTTTNYNYTTQGQPTGRAPQGGPQGRQGQ